MDGPTLKELPLFNTIGYPERKNVLASLKRPLSGYLGGSTPRGGYWTDRLETEWCDTFGCRYSIPCNSATSGLLAACMAAGVGPGDRVWTTTYSMSATAACAMVLGAVVSFIDIEPIRYSLNYALLNEAQPPRVLIVTNLFGHPAHLAVLRAWCDDKGVIMIEDNAQSIFAKENGKYAGTIGHMGVFSLNVHKHLQVGEGGVICTNEPEFSARLRHAINHGELAGASYYNIGLNLRMTEPTAAMACAQLAKGEKIVEGRKRIANAISYMMRGAFRVKAPITDIDCTHSFYVWAGRVEPPWGVLKFVHELNIRGFPIRAGYSKPLNQVFRIGGYFPMTHKIEDSIITYEVCTYDPKAHHIARMREIVEYVSESMGRTEQWTSQAAK